MNNYIKILTHLQQFAGDTKLHEIHSFLDELGLTTNKQKQSILSDLKRSEYVFYAGGTQGGQMIINGQTFGSFYEKPFEAKITIQGLQHLKHELEMEKQGSNNFRIKGNNNNVIIDSKNVTIQTKSEVEKYIKSIINAIEADKSIELEIKESYKGTFLKLRTEMAQNDVNQNTLKEIMSIGSNLSSIGSLVLSIMGLLPLP